MIAAAAICDPPNSSAKAGNIMSILVKSLRHLLNKSRVPGKINATKARGEIAVRTTMRACRAANTINAVSAESAAGIKNVKRMNPSAVELVATAADDHTYPATPPPANTTLVNVDQVMSPVSAVVGIFSRILTNIDCKL